MRDLKPAYWDQKRLAAKRNIGWQLTFEEWLNIWQQSGHLHERGRGIGKYCMCRYGDVGPYSVNNVFIQTNEKNSSEAHKGKPGRPMSEFNKEQLLKSHLGAKRSDETRQKMSAAAKGKKKPLRSEETRKKLSEALKGRTFPHQKQKKSLETREKMKQAWILRKERMKA